MSFWPYLDFNLVGHMTNYFLNMELKIEVFIYNLKKFGRGNISDLVIICIQSWILFNFSAISGMPKIGLKRRMKCVIEHFVTNNSAML